MANAKAHLTNPRFDYLAGAVSGALGSAYNSHGVPIVIYGTLKKWPVDELRGILQAHFVCVGLLVVMGQASAGFWNFSVVKLLLIIVPLLVIVVPFGNWVASKIAPDRLVRYIFGLLVVFGGLLLTR
ncbi:TSUP family transporter [Secundilactobacillus kimchicus]|uniref:TSUP family transporter n=1 Tax=Secundilactobacillus kimchicus TaxID=528209 RepID=UPI0024A96FC2|nr:TSUP family transporter [Secundilactobacillus kimchicus]